MTKLAAMPIRFNTRVDPSSRCHNDAGAQLAARKRASTADSLDHFAGAAVLRVVRFRNNR
jgi:hypothetical protein